MPEALREQIEKINLHRKTTWVSAAAVPVSMVGTAGYYLLDKPILAIPMAAYDAVAAAIGIWSARRKAALTRELAPQLARNEQASSLMAKKPTHIRVKSKIVEFFRAPHLKGMIFEPRTNAPVKPNPPTSTTPKQTRPASRQQQLEPPKPQATQPIRQRSRPPPLPPRRSRK